MPMRTEQPIFTETLSSCITNVQPRKSSTLGSRTGDQCVVTREKITTIRSFVTIVKVDGSIEAFLTRRIRSRGRAPVEKPSLPQMRFFKMRELQPFQDLRHALFEDRLPFGGQNAVAILLSSSDIVELFGSRSVVDIAVGIAGDKCVGVR